MMSNHYLWFPAGNIIKSCDFSSPPRASRGGKCFDCIRFWLQVEVFSQRFYRSTLCYTMIKRCLINYYSWVITVQHIYNNMFISGMHAYCTQLVHLIVQMLMINLCTLFALIGNEYSLTMNSMTMIGIEDKILLQYNKMQTPKVWIYDAPVWVCNGWDVEDISMSLLKQW